jgi:hypothetical protein
MSRNAKKIDARVRRDMSVELGSEVRIKAAPVSADIEVDVETLERWAANHGVQEVAPPITDSLDVACDVQGEASGAVESVYEGLAEAVRLALLESELVEPAGEWGGEGPLRSPVRSGLAFRKASARGTPFFRRLCRASAGPVRGGRTH